MRAITVGQPGGPETLTLLTDASPPEIGPGEVRIRVRLAALNFMDVLGRRGDYPIPITYPWIPGAEGCGIVEAIGEEVTTLSVGQRVAFIGRGSYAEIAVAPAHHCFPVPDSLSDETAAAFPLQGLTAYHALHTAGQVREGESVLVHAAAGGVGGNLVQLAKRAGCQVIGTASSQEKLDYIMGLGADHAINYREEDFMKGVRRFYQGPGIDCVFDSIGKDTLIRDFRVLRPFGRVVLYGLASGQPDLGQMLEQLYVKSAALRAFSLYTVLALPELLQESAKELIALIEAGALEIKVSETLPLARARDAHELLEGRKTMGKVLLAV